MGSDERDGYLVSVLDSRRQELQALQTRLAKTRRMRALNEQTARLVVLQETVERQTAAAHALKREYDRARAEVHAMRTSASWRISAPGRWLYDAVVRGRKPADRDAGTTTTHASAQIHEEPAPVETETSRSRDRWPQDVEEELARLDRLVLQAVEELRSLGEERVDFGDFRRVTPLSPVWGLDRGRPVDRYYIERFLERHRHDIRGRVVEIKDDGYTRAFGDGVTGSDVLDINPDNRRATIVGDLTNASAIPDGTYDCFILTQTLGLIFDVPKALAEAARILKPGGVLLCTVAAVSRISYEEGLDHDFWRFTGGSLQQLFAAVRPRLAFEISTFGNVLACAAFLFGLADSELRPADLESCDPFFPLVFGIRATKAAGV